MASLDEVAGAKQPPCSRNGRTLAGDQAGVVQVIDTRSMDAPASAIDARYSKPRPVRRIVELAEYDPRHEMRRCRT